MHAPEDTGEIKAYHPHAALTWKPVSVWMHDIDFELRIKTKRPPGGQRQDVGLCDASPLEPGLHVTSLSNGNRAEGQRLFTK